VLVPDRVPGGRDADRGGRQSRMAQFCLPNTLGVLSPAKRRRHDRGRAESARHGSSPAFQKVSSDQPLRRHGSSTGYISTVRSAHFNHRAHRGRRGPRIRIPDAALMFEADPLTEAIVIFGEIGSSQKRSWRS